MRDHAVAAPSRLPGWLAVVTRGISPARVVAASFLSLIGVGTLLLSLPAAAEREGVGLVDALFTATSAVCVTGLTVVDTGRTFSLFGEMSILFLIQVGGLGIATFSTFFTLMLGRKLTFRERDVLKGTVLPFAIGDLRSLLARILLLTALFEGVGALLLAWAWWRPLPLGEALYAALFHAVSAFCNAGFSQFPTNLQAFRADPATVLIVTTLIICGGIGFLVVLDLQASVRRRRRLSLHTKLVLTVTAGLLAAGTLGILLLERENLLAHLPWGERLLAAYFQAVTPRTAGFNTLPIGGLATPTLLFLILLMFIGASPGSTGGGIKTATFGILVGLARSRFRGREEVELFGRRVPGETVARALAIYIASVLLLIVFLFLLLLTEIGPATHAEARAGLLHLAFEAVSAFGTVGLSTGVTPGLSSAGKLLITALMFIGRVGPLTLAIAVGERQAQSRYRYSEEDIMVG